ncbi:immunoglobulin-like domain-containing protein [Clostridium sp.]|uniref:immunoglobulin-like domain-containing protein n=1 Tax=Clostridium sp. TaxID=1506 RepID=UPI001D4AE8F4|nr:immunoglobulin-like domain-containing protein [Clostridium sp.]MBS5938562.1 DUF5011 domain-containing protein [Clostridium sp.]
MKSKKSLAKVAIASTLALTSTVAIVYATPKFKEVQKVNNEDKFELVVEKVDSDTVKVALDNIEDIPKALQFSVKLEGASLKDGKNSIKDLITSEVETRLSNKDYSSSSNEILVDYTVNEENNTIDVLITAENSIPKTGNKIEVFELDVKSPDLTNLLAKGEAPKYKVIPTSNYEYKYISNTNKEYYTTNVEYNKNNIITMNTAPKISLEYKYLEVTDGEKLELTAENLGITMSDDDEDDKLKLEVKKGKDIITEFVEDKPGIYDLQCTVIDSFGERSDTVTVQVNVVQDDIKTPPTFTQNGEELKDITIDAGERFEPLDGVKAIDAKGREVADIKVTSDKDIDLDPEADTEYKITYTAIDTYGNKGEKTITLTVKANKAPVILGVKDHVLKVGDKFDPKDDVTVEDEDKNIELQVESNVNTSIPGTYRVLYSATDSKGKTTKVQSKVVVNPKITSINKAPIIYAEDRTIKVGDYFDPLDGVKAIDPEDNDITNDIVVTGDIVDVNTPGEYKITYTVEDSQKAKTTKTIKVTVEKNISLATSITIDSKINQLYIGSSSILTATVNKEADIKDIEWSTSDENIAEIEVLGRDAKVIAKSEGQVTITASTIDGSNKSDSLTIDIINFDNNDEIPSFIVSIVDKDIVTPLYGIGDVNDPLVLEVKNTTVEEFNKFIKDLEKLKTTLEDKYVDGNSTVYKIKVEKKINLFKFFKDSNDGYIEIRIDNRLDNYENFKDQLDLLLDAPENPGDGNNPGDENNPEDGNNPGNGNNPEDGNNPSDGNNPGDGNNSGDGENSEIGNNSGNGENSGEENNTEIEDSNNKDNVGKLPITGQESIIGFIGIAALGTGAFLLRKKKKEK